MYAVKANRQYKISEDEKQKFIDQGYKIAKLEDGNLVFEEIETEETKEIVRLEKENKKLKKELEKLNAELNKDNEKEEKKKGEGK